jgi:hypothetical protein
VAAGCGLAANALHDETKSIHRKTLKATIHPVLTCYWALQKIHIFLKMCVSLTMVVFRSSQCSRHIFWLLTKQSSEASSHTCEYSSSPSFPHPTCALFSLLDLCICLFLQPVSSVHFHHMIQKCQSVTIFLFCTIKYVEQYGSGWYNLLLSDYNDLILWTCFIQFWNMFTSLVPFHSHSSFLKILKYSCVLAITIFYTLLLT